jgi:hypothetical protein
MKTTIDIIKVIKTITQRIRSETISDAEVMQANAKRGRNRK